MTTLLTALTGSAVMTSGTAPSIGKFNVYNATSGSLIATLPTLATPTIGARLVVGKYLGDTSANTVTINCAGSDTFQDGSTSIVLALSGQSRELQVISVSGTRYWTTLGGISSKNTPVDVSSTQSLTNKSLTDPTNTFPASLAAYGVASTATAAGTTTLVVGSAPTQVFTGSTTQTVLLPTTGVVAGQQFRVINSSSGTVTVQSSNAQGIKGVATSSAALFTALVATPTTAANWLFQLEFNGTFVAGVNITAPGIGSVYGGNSFTVYDQNSKTSLVAAGGASSAANYVQTQNSSTTVAPSVGVAGTDTNIGLNFTTKGTGTVQANGVNIQTASRVLNAQTGTTYTTVLSDAGALVTLSNASAITLTVPPNSSVAYPVGTFIDLAQIGAGQVTVAPGSGVTINSTPGLKISAQYGGATLTQTAANTWLLVGALSA